MRPLPPRRRRPPLISAFGDVLLAQGLAIETLSDPEWDVREAVDQIALAARSLVGALSAPA